MEEAGASTCLTVALASPAGLCRKAAGVALQEPGFCENQVFSGPSKILLGN